MNHDLATATTALAERRSGDVLAPLERAAAVDTPDPAHWRRVVEIASQIGDDDLALSAARRLLGLAPRDPALRSSVADLLSDTGNVRDAVAITRKLLDENPRHPMLPAALGDQLSRLGRDDEALRSLRLAIRRDPGMPTAWESLSNLRTFRAGDPEFVELEKLARASADRPETAGYAFAYAKACDDVGDVDAAYEWFARANRRVLGGRVPGTDGLYSAAADVRAAFPPGRASAVAPADRPERPILVLGCPRSGTTLAERILSTAHGATPGGELKLLRLACLGFAPPSPARLAEFVRSSGDESAAWESVARTYVAKLQTRFGRADGVIDKGLVNYLYVGALALGLPQARILHLRRDPMDVAWSCFRRRFHEGLDWSYAFDSIAAFLSVYEATVEHWKQVLPGRILTVRFEALVSDPEAVTAQMFEFAGLERPADWQTFHERRGVVLTASQRQVRRPLNADGVGAWRRYERHLAPLKDALRRHGVPGASDL
ncbi:MAG: sulfotransferase [Steroidobacteraceae bacterium]